MTRGSILIRATWGACLLVGGLNHVRILAQHGLFWDYHGANPISAVYWSSLTLLDPLVAVLLFLRPKAGIVGTILLIVTNVAHNLAITAHSGPAGELLARVAAAPFLLSQIGFMLFVLGTAPAAWRGLPQAAAADAP